MKKRLVLIAIAALLLAATATWLLMSPTPDRVEKEDPSSPVSADAASLLREKKAPSASARADTASVSRGEEEPSASDSTADPQTEEERAEAEAEAKVEAFDNLTDRWVEPAKAGVTMKDVGDFVGSFRQVPKDRQDECIHRALNLIPDENVMLLAGVLMDKSMDKEIAETVFNDMLNRDEDVKKPILQQIFKDKTHPCWADTAWILDVTGEASAAVKSK